MKPYIFIYLNNVNRKKKCDKFEDDIFGDEDCMKYIYRMIV